MNCSATPSPQGFQEPQLEWYNPQKRNRMLTHPCVCFFDPRKLNKTAAGW